MKSFFKTFFASFLGSAVLLAVIIILLVSSLVSSIASSSKTKVDLKPKTVLYMNLNYSIPDRTSTNNFNFNLSELNLDMSNSDKAGMNDILNNIKAAATDPNISGIFLELSSVGTSTAYLEEIRNSLIEFKKSGKFIISYADNYSQSAYYLATAADKIYMLPNGTLNINGLASQSMFFKGLLDKLDIEMQIIRPENNKFKSAVEPYFLDKMSEANREQTSVLLNSVWSKICNDISSSRNISVETINKYANELTFMFDTKKTVTEKFIDELVYRDQIIEKLHILTNTPKDKKINIIQNTQYAKVRPDIYEGDDEIAIVYASGEIIDGEGDDSTIGSITLSEAIREARDDNNVKAIVMRVNSPGGSAIASEVIRREVELAAKEKPFIVSMGNYAASGGYWISSSSDYIFADPATLTGSIGVFGTFPNLKNFFNDKIGLTFDAVTTNENANFGNLGNPLNDYQLSILQKSVTNTYDEFITLVSNTRDLNKSFVDSIGQGRVWSGMDAIKIGLVDEIGGIEKAITHAAEKAGLKEFSIKEFPEQEDIFKSMFNEEPQEYYTKSMLKKNLGENYKYVEALERLNRLNGIQALMPFTYIN